MQSLHTRTFAALDNGPLLQVTRAVHGRVLASEGAAPRTVLGELAVSALAETAASGTFRRVTRPRGPLVRYTGGGALDLVAHDGVARDFQRPYVDLDGVMGVSEAAARVINPDVVGAVLGLGAIDATTGWRVRIAPRLSTATLSDRIAWLTFSIAVWAMLWIVDMAVAGEGDGAHRTWDEIRLQVRMFLAAGFIAVAAPFLVTLWQRLSRRTFPKDVQCGREV